MYVGCASIWRNCFRAGQYLNVAAFLSYNWITVIQYNTLHFGLKKGNAVCLL